MCGLLVGWQWGGGGLVFSFDVLCHKLNSVCSDWTRRDQSFCKALIFIKYLNYDGKIHHSLTNIQRIAKHQTQQAFKVVYYFLTFCSFFTFFPTSLIHSLPVSFPSHPAKRDAGMNTSELLSLWRYSPILVNAQLYVLLLNFSFLLNDCFS